MASAYKHAMKSDDSDSEQENQNGVDEQLRNRILMLTSRGVSHR